MLPLDSTSALSLWTPAISPLIALLMWTVSAFFAASEWVELLLLVGVQPINGRLLGTQAEATSRAVSSQAPTAGARAAPRSGSGIETTSRRRDHSAWPVDRKDWQVRRSGCVTGVRVYWSKNRYRDLSGEVRSTPALSRNCRGDRRVRQPGYPRRETARASGAKARRAFRWHRSVAATGYRAARTSSS